MPCIDFFFAFDLVLQLLPVERWTDGAGRWDWPQRKYNTENIKIIGRLGYCPIYNKMIIGRAAPTIFFHIFMYIHDSHVEAVLGFSYSCTESALHAVHA